LILYHQKICQSTWTFPDLHLKKDQNSCWLSYIFRLPDSPQIYGLFWSYLDLIIKFLYRFYWNHLKHNAVDFYIYHFLGHQFSPHHQSCFDWTWTSLNEIQKINPGCFNHKSFKRLLHSFNFKINYFLNSLNYFQFKIQISIEININAYLLSL